MLYLNLLDNNKSFTTFIAENVGSGNLPLGSFFGGQAGSIETRPKYAIAVINAQSEGEVRNYWVLAAKDSLVRAFLREFDEIPYPAISNLVRITENLDKEQEGYTYRMVQDACDMSNFDLLNWISGRCTTSKVQQLAGILELAIMYGRIEHPISSHGADKMMNLVHYAWQLSKEVK